MLQKRLQERIDRKRQALDDLRPLPAAAVQRLQEEMLVEWCNPARQKSQEKPERGATSTIDQRQQCREQCILERLADEDIDVPQQVAQDEAS